MNYSQSPITSVEQAHNKDNSIFLQHVSPNISLFLRRRVSQLSTWITFGFPRS